MNLQTTEVTQDKLLPVELKFVSTNIWKVKSVLRCLIDYFGFCALSAIFEQCNGGD